MSFLDRGLATLPHDSDSKSAVLVTLWEPNVNAEEVKRRSGSYDAYIRHIYNDLCRVACTGTYQISAFTHKQLLEVCKLLCDPGSTQASVLGTLGQHTPETERLVRLAAAVLVPLNISGVGGARPGRSVNWDRDQSIKNLFDASIKPATATATAAQVATPIPVQLPTDLNARNLEYVAGFDIVWTSTITDHLRVVEIDDSIKLYLFHQTGLLEMHRKLTNRIIPEDLILETLETLALLVPRRDPDVKKWFNKLQKKYNLDPGVGACDHLSLEFRSLDHFNYWKNRLKIIKELYDGQEPNSPLQVWRDRRKPVQWWTFWIAVLVLVLTVIFGLIQSITGILQVKNSH